MPQALQSAMDASSSHTVVLARIVRGMSSESWQEASAIYDLDQWQVFPVPLDGVQDVEALASPTGDAPAISPFREVRGALTRNMFLNLLKRELIRLARNGGCMSLVCAGIAERRRLSTALGEGTVARLEGIMGSILLSQLEGCDSLGMLRQGQFVCSLPGLGQLAARSFAEKAQKAFIGAASPFFPTGGISAGSGATCALGIVNIMQGDSGSARELLNRAKTVLEVALSKEEGHIHQETSIAPLENTTLVQSSEKRFLFFGGDPS